MKQKFGTVISLILFMAVISMCLFGCTTKFNYQDMTKAKFYDEGDGVFRVGETNNGAEKYSAEMDRLTSVVPNQQQLDFLELEYYNFIHYGMNTFTGNEWGDGKESPSKYNPTTVDTDQWCEVLKSSGSKGIIFTAKHHDGFCLWQTDTTEHSIKNSPYKNGKGDIVQQLAESCKKYGLKLGLYLSPWDQNAPQFGLPEYNDFFIDQLTELCTNYGEMFCFWFDGANGSTDPVKKNYQYQWERIYNVIRTLQPNAAIANMGPDVRWVGNEAGVARDSEWCTKGGTLDQKLIADMSQTNPEMAKKLNQLDHSSEDLGSREILSAFETLNFYPAEADVSIRKGWFYHKSQSPKSLQHLLKIYYKTAGANCSMLLNVPPNKNGKIDDKDAKRLKDFGDRIAQDYSSPVSYTAKIGTVGNMREREEIGALYSESRDSLVMNDGDTVIDLKLDKPKLLTMISMREDLRHGERIEKYDVYVKSGSRWKLVSNSTNVGNRRTVVISNANRAYTDEVRIVIRQSRKNPVIRSIMLYE